PALSFVDRTLLLLWVGTDANRSLNVMESTDGIAFRNKKTLPQSSNFPPALVSDSGHLYLAWTEKEREQRLRLMRGETVPTLGNEQTYTSNTGAAAPALVSFKGALYLLWTGNEDRRRLNIAQISDVPSLGDCFIKLRPDLTLADWFTPWNT